jgi:putative DNA primase/helicase
MTTSKSNFIELYVSAGWAVVPLRGKVPVLPDWPNLVVRKEDVSRLFPNGQNCGLILGDRSGGLIDIDIDDLVALRVAPYFLPTTPFVFGRPSKPKSHWLYIASEARRTCKFQGPDGDMFVEIRSNGAQTMAPPSVHPSGERVCFSDLTVNGIPVPAPVEFKDLLDAVSRISAAALLAKSWPAPGSRQDAAMALAGGLLRSGWNQEQAVQFVRAVVDAAGDPELDRRLDTVMHTFRKLQGGTEVTGWPKLAELFGEKPVSRAREWLGVISSTTVEARGNVRFHCSDTGNGKRLAARHGEKLKFLSSGKHGGWYVWDGKVWTLDTPAAERLAKETVQSIYHEAGDSADEVTRKKLADWALRSEAAERVAAMLRLAQSELQISARIEEFDRNPYLLNCRNGILDLRTGILSKHDPAQKLTKMAGTDYDPAADCPTWLRFLDEITEANSDLANFLQRCVGYSLTGDVSERKFFLCYGVGANGKSSFLETLREVLGDYGQAAEFNTFLRATHGRSGPRDDVAHLRGARFVAVGEASAGRSFDEAILKQLTGNDSVRCRHLYGAEFEYKPQFKLFLATNHRPHLRPDAAIMQRIVLIPFNAVFPPDRQDKNLRDKFRTEMPGILAWAVRGGLAWQENGLVVPAEVKEAIEDYRIENDPISGFAGDRCILDPKSKSSAKELYEAYCAWWGRNPEQRTSTDTGKPQSQKWFGSRLHDMGLQKRNTRDGVVWHGIRLQTTACEPYGLP